jgi:hypothetical protein
VISLRHHIVAWPVVAMLAGCATPSVRTEGDTSALNVVAVSVDTSAMKVSVEGRTSPVTKEQLAADLTGYLTSSLAEKSDPNGKPVNVAIVMSKVRLAPPIERVVAGTSTAKGTVTVTEVGTDNIVVPTTEVTGNTENFRFVSVIGLATTVTVEKDYRGTLKGFATTVRTALFGPEQ